MSEHHLIAFTQAILRQPSESGQENAVVELIRAEMQALGFDRVWIDGNGSVAGVVAGAAPAPQSCATAIATPWALRRASPGITIPSARRSRMVSCMGGAPPT